MPKFKVPAMSRRNAKTLRRRSTDAEMKLWHLLRSRRLAHTKFRRQVPIGPWIVDFVSFEYRIIVEADGGQHADSSRDQSRDADLAHRGFRVLRFWNNDVLQNPIGVLERIVEALGSSPSPGGLWPPPSPNRSRIYPTSIT